MYIKIDNMIDLRAFCLEQAIKMKCEYQINGNRITCESTDLAKEYEAYILDGMSLPNQPFNSDKLLYDTMTEIIKNKEIQENEVV
jgi:hypothetical protein